MEVTDLCCCVQISTTLQNREVSVIDNVNHFNQDGQVPGPCLVWSMCQPNKGSCQSVGPYNSPTVHSGGEEKDGTSHNGPSDKCSRERETLDVSVLLPYLHKYTHSHFTLQWKGIFTHTQTHTYCTWGKLMYVVQKGLSLRLIAHSNYSVTVPVCVLFDACVTHRDCRLCRLLKASSGTDVNWLF